MTRGGSRIPIGGGANPGGANVAGMSFMAFHFMHVLLSRMNDKDKQQVCVIVWLC